MIAEWVEKMTGSIEQKKRYREYRGRIKRLPANHRRAIEALDRYLMYFGSIADGEILLAMLNDLADLFEQSAVDGKSVRAIVGDDPVEFAESFLRNYAEGQWITKERDRLIRAIASAAGEDASTEEETDR